MLKRAQPARRVFRLYYLLFWKSAMKTLFVKDLCMTEKMEPKAMARVRGGILYGFDPSRHDPDPGSSPRSPLPLPSELPKFPPYFPFQLVAKPPIVTI